MSDEDKRKLKLKDKDSFLESENVASATECTGLTPTPPASEEEAESYEELYNIHMPQNKVNNHLQETDKS